MKNKRPNILLITSDQQHWNTLGFLNPQLKTPNLDSLASQGTYFDRAYCCNPTCTPTRASIITGQYPSQHGAYSLGTKLDESVHTVGQDFQNAGYRTALIGKAHFQPLKSTEQYPSIEAPPILKNLDFWRKFHGPFYGFERIELARNHTVEQHVGQHYAVWLEEHGCRNWEDYFRPINTGKHKWELPEELHYNTWISEKTNELMESYKENDENFFLWASFFDPHPPVIVPEPWASMYDPKDIEVPTIHPGEHDKNPPHFAMTQEQDPDFSDWQEPNGHNIHGFHSHLSDKEEEAKNIAVYYGMVSMMDKYIGKILDKLESLGLADDTIVVFTTDHGHFFGHHGLLAKGPFHYEDMIKVPFIVRYPDNVPANKISHSMQSLVDLAPTFLNMCGIKVPACMTGIDQSDSWKSIKDCRDSILVENRHQPTTVHMKTYVDARYKITVYYNREYGELYDLETDPKEVNNLWDSDEHQDLKNKLIKKLLFFEMGKEPLPMPRIAVA